MVAKLRKYDGVRVGSTARTRRAADAANTKLVPKKDLDAGQVERDVVNAVRAVCIAKTWLSGDPAKFHNDLVPSLDADAGLGVTERGQWGNYCGPRSMAGACFFERALRAMSYEMESPTQPDVRTTHTKTLRTTYAVLEARIVGQYR